MERTIKTENSKELKDINLTPISNTVITSAFIEAQESSLFLGDNHQPTFRGIQRVYAVGPNVEFCKPGDWVYLDLNRYIKTVKTKSTIRAGVGGEDMIREQFVPPLWAAPNDMESTYFKITDREIEGVINDASKLELSLDTYEEFVARNEKFKEEIAENAAKEQKAENERLKGKEIPIGRKGPVIRTSTSPKLNS